LWVRWAWVKSGAGLSSCLVRVRGASARAERLSAVMAGGVGFHPACSRTLLASDRSLSFSRLALSLAESQAAQGKKGSRRQSVF
jgi:hypothetical protein